MKLLVYIFSLYLLVLSCIPCNDTLAAVPGISLTTITASPADQHTDHVDFCSPLCVCSCCNVQLLTNSHWQYIVIHPQQHYIYPVYTASISTAGSNAIWQPPRPVAA